MIKILVKKQLMEVFKGYFYDSKRNKARSKASTIAWFLFFAVIMVGVLGGTFGGLAFALCGGLVEANVGWLYFVVMGGMAVLIGALGSVFSTYAGLFLAKDNDLLLSMPIPVKDIIAARLVNVYVLGALYSSIAILPALFVYWIVADHGVKAIVCGLVLALIISILILVLSCLLGWFVAKISLKIKNKSVVTLITSLVFLGVYYSVCFRAQNLIQDLLLNAEKYGNKIQGGAHWIYVFGKVGEGDLASAGTCAVIVVASLIVLWRLLSRNFISIVTSSGSTKKTKYIEKEVKEKSDFRALIDKEVTKFVSSSSYMMNCGLGIIFILVGAVAFLIKGTVLLELMGGIFTNQTSCASIIFVTSLMMLSSTCDMSAPSVSLEGKSIWIPQSLPVEPKMVLRAKAMTHLIFVGPPMILAIVSVIIVTKPSLVEALLIATTSIIFTLFAAVFSTFLGIKMVNLQWTNEIVPIKQGGAVAISLFGTWAISVAFGGLYMWKAYTLGNCTYLGIWSFVLAIAVYLMLHWIDTKGAEKFAFL